MFNKKWMYWFFLSILGIDITLFLTTKISPDLLHPSVGSIALGFLLVGLAHVSYLLFATSVLQLEGFTFQLTSFIVSSILALNLFGCIRGVTRNMTIPPEDITRVIRTVLDWYKAPSFYIINAVVVGLVFYCYMRYCKIELSDIKESLSSKKQVLNFLYEVIVLSVPYYFFSFHNIASKYVVIPLGLYMFIKNRRNWTKLEKIYGVFTIGFLFCIIVSSILNKEFIGNTEFKRIKNLCIIFLYVISTARLITNKTLLQKTYFVAVSAFVSTLSMMVFEIFLFGFLNRRVGMWDYGATVSIFANVTLLLMLAYRKLYLLPLYLIAVITIIIEGSRMGLASVIVGIFCIVAIVTEFNIKKLMVSALLITICLGATYPISPMRSLYNNRRVTIDSGYRKAMWGESLTQIKEKPLWGNGYITLHKHSPERHTNAYIFPHKIYPGDAHNNIIEMTRAHGMIGLSLYILFQLFTLITSFKLYKKSKNYLFLLPVIAMLSVEIVGVTNTNLNSKSFIAQMLFIGLLLSIKNLCYSEEKS